MADDVWILGIHMTKFGKHPDSDVIDLASEAALAAMKDAGVSIADIGIVAAGNLMGGAVFEEIIFARPGMGTLIYNAIKTRNYPIVQAGVLVIAFLFVVANLLADVTYTWLDPRIQLGRRQE